MKRNKTTAFDYIKIRSEQLREDRDKTTDPMDKQWYNRVIEELNWVCISLSQKQNYLKLKKPTTQSANGLEQ